MIFQQAIKQNLLFDTSVGQLNVIELYSLPLGDEKANFGNQPTLNDLAVQLSNEYKSSGGLNFLLKTRKSRKDKTLKLKRDVVLAILEDKLEDRFNAQEAADKRAHNAKIDQLIVEKKEEEMKSLSVKELEKMRR